MDIPSNINDVLQKANDGESAKLGQEITDLLNMGWKKLSEVLGGEGVPPVVSLSYSPDHDAFVAILDKYIKFDYEKNPPKGTLQKMNIVASVYNTFNGETGEEEVAIDMDYYYGDAEFGPVLYNGRELADGETITKFDHIPTTIDIMRMVVETDSATPLFDIDQNAPFYDQIEPFLTGSGEQPPKIGHPEGWGDDLPSEGMTEHKVDMGQNGHVRQTPTVEAADAVDNSDEVPEECKDCDVKAKCTACEDRAKCACPCYDPENPPQTPASWPTSGAEAGENPDDPDADAEDDDPEDCACD